MDGLLEKKYKIYDLNDYRISKNKETNDYDNNDRCKIYEGNIKEICEELYKNKGYNMRLRDDDNVILFGDLDGYQKDINDFEEELRYFLMNLGIELSKEDFYYTENKGYNKGGKSYHYSIPKYYGKIKNIKKLINKFKENMNYKTELDVTIYSDKWWRMPNQKKNNKNDTEHIIEKGEMKDFVVTYINGSICLDNIIENGEDITVNLYSEFKNKKNSNEDKINNEENKRVNNNILIELGEIINNEFIDNYNDWLKIVWSLKKEGEDNKELAKYISKKSLKYEEDTFEKIWNQYKKTDITLTIGSFLYMAKKSNEKEYLKIIRKYNNEELRKIELIYDDESTISDITLSNIGFSKIDNKLKEIGRIIEKILEIRSDYFNNKNEFYELGCIIKNESKDDDDLGMEYFQNLCKTKLNNYNEKQFYKYWYSINSYDNKKLTIKTLRNKLNEIVPEINNINNIFELVNDYSIAEEWTKRYGDKYICIDIENKRFLEWNGIWEETKSGSNIRLSLSTEFKKIFKEAKLNALNDLKNKKKSEDMEETIKELIKRYENIIDKLENNTSKNKILKEIQDQIQDKNKIMEKMNKSKYELPLKNCKMFNIQTLETRERTLKDYFNYECPVNYIEMLEEEEKEIKDYFLSLFSDNEITLQCVLDIIKSQLIGQPIKHIFFWIGEGNNGKSILFDILHSIFNNAFDVISNDVIIEKKSNSNITTELEKLIKCRVGYITEVREEDKLNSTTIKKITGGDRIDVRGLQTTNITRTPTANLNVLSNELPQFKVEQGLLNRIIVIPFKNKFVKDLSFKQKMLKKSDNIFSYIMKYGRIRETFDESEEMEDAKKDYKDNNERDFLRDFILDKCELNNEGRITRDEFRIEYNNWCKSRNYKRDNSTDRGFTNKFLKICPECECIRSNNINYYYGIRFCIL